MAETKGLYSELGRGGRNGRGGQPPALCLCACDHCLVHPGPGTHHLSVSGRKAGFLVYEMSLVPGHWICSLSLSLAWRKAGTRNFHSLEGINCCGWAPQPWGQQALVSHFDRVALSKAS